jgi:Rha family phage regulatory protein
MRYKITRKEQKMNNLLLKAVTEKKGQPVTTSRKIAKIFGKRHDHVLRDIDIVKEKSSPIFGERNFLEATYKTRGKNYREVLMTKDGFTMVAFSYTTDKAMKFKEAYINQFNKMADFIQSLQTAKLEFPAFTNAIMNAHEEPKHYHFSNEINMINRIVLGMTASEFKKTNGIDKKVKSIRPYLDNEQIKSIEELQRIDIGLIVAIDDYEARKQILINYFNNSKLKQIA